VDRKGKSILSYNHALSVLGEIRSEMDRNNGSWDPNVYKKQSKTNFSALWSKYLKKYEDQISTYSKIKAIGEYHLFYFNEIQMRDITPVMIDDWWESMKQKKLSAHYMNDILQFFKSFFKYAYKLSIIEKVPQYFPDPLKLPDPEVEDWLSADEQLKLLQAFDYHERPIFDFLFLTGVRVNEACALRKADIKWDKQEIIVSSTIKRDGSIGPVKNNHRRAIPIVDEINDCLTKALKMPRLSPFVFINPRSRNRDMRYTDDYLRDRLNQVAIETIGRKIKLKNSSRHSFGNQLAARGVPMDTIREVMNHSDNRITRHYVNMQASYMADLYGRKNNRAE
jgi:integrase